jgi:phenylacetate-CoA ligase
VAETLTNDVRELARQTWWAPVLDNYGTTEAGVIGAECRWALGLHVIEDLIILEVVDENYQPVPRGVTGHKVLVTSLFNRALPLIRYEFSDIVAAEEGACPCGRSHLRLTSIKGRQEDVLYLPSRMGGKVAVNAYVLGEALRQVRDIREYQFVPQGAKLRIHVVLGETMHAEKAMEAAQRALGPTLDEVGAALDALTIESVNHIERVGTGAKHRPLSTVLGDADAIR